MGGFADVALLGPTCQCHVCVYSLHSLSSLTPCPNSCGLAHRRPPTRSPSAPLAWAPAPRRHPRAHCPRALARPRWRRSGSPCSHAPGHGGGGAAPASARPRAPGGGGGGAAPASARPRAPGGSSGRLPSRSGGGVAPARPAWAERLALLPCDWHGGGGGRTG